MNSTLRELYRHKTWATLRLIEFCQRLPSAQLDATVAGTFGTIRETLRHLVSAEEGYFTLITGEKLSDPPALESAREGPVSLGELADRIRRLGPRWEDLAEDAETGAREVTTSDGWRMAAAIPMAQTIHHADDHRTHVMSILGALGVETPEPNGLDVWGYAEAMNVARPVALDTDE